MIGVDIIDRSCSFELNKRHSFNDYISRIVNHSEYEFCLSWIDLDLIWAIKESSYKCYYKKTNKSFINPKRIRITELDLKLKIFRVEIEELYFTGRFQIAREYVYAISTDKDNFADEVQLFLLDDFKNSVQIHHEFEPYRFTYLHHKDGFPEAVKDSKVVFAYSRSHHGKYFFSAISLTPHN